MEVLHSAPGALRLPSRWRWRSGCLFATIRVFCQRERLFLLFFLPFALFCERGLACSFDLLSVDFFYLVVGFLSASHFVVSAFALIAEFEIKTAAPLLLLLTHFNRG